MNLTLEDVRGVLVNATVNSPKGTIDTPDRAYTVYNNDQLTKADQYNDVILAWRNGAPVRVRDIGQAIDGPENQFLAGWQNGKRGIVLIVFKQPGANVIETVERHQGQAAAAGGFDPALGEGLGHHGPDADDPRFARGRAVHADAVDRPGGDGDLPVPAQLLGDRHSRRSPCRWR